MIVIVRQSYGCSPFYYLAHLHRVADFTLAVPVEGNQYEAHYSSKERVRQRARELGLKVERAIYEVDTKALLLDHIKPAAPPADLVEPDYIARSERTRGIV